MNILKFKPTPIQKLNFELNNNTIFVKRDDLIPFSFGGNKVRKGLLFFDDLLKNDFKSVVTYGSSSSNHCRIIANLSAMFNLPCFIISPNETNKKTFNSQIIHELGAKIINCNLSDVSETINKTVESLNVQELKPYFIQGGGHGNLGTQAYVNAYNEILSFEEEENIKFDYIFLTSGTGATQAGLICGSLLNKDNKQIIGISNARKNPYGSQVVLESVESFLSYIDFQNASEIKVNYIDEFILEGYGSYNSEVVEIISKVMINSGINLDRTYTGKAFWGMSEFLKKRDIVGKRILFIHTGGTPIFFDDLECKE